MSWNISYDRNTGLIYKLSDFLDEIEASTHSSTYACLHIYRVCTYVYDVSAMQIILMCM